MSALTIRKVVEADLSMFCEFLRQMASDEGLAAGCTLDVETLSRSLFHSTAAVEAILVEQTSRAVGLAIFFHGFCKLTGKLTLHLEDLFVHPSARRNGVAVTLMHHLAQLAISRECVSLNFGVLNDNDTAIAFYESLGADRQYGIDEYAFAGVKLLTLAALR